MIDHEYALGARERSLLWVAVHWRWLLFGRREVCMHLPTIRVRLPTIIPSRWAISLQKWQ